MIKLLNAGFTRLRKNKLFWLFMIFSIGLALLMTYMGYSNMKRYKDTIAVEQIFLNYSTIIGVVIAIFTSLFLGAEYSDGAIRNKISIGHKRINIYLSNLLVVIVTSLFSYILFLVIVAIIGIPLFGSITIEVSKLWILLGCIFIAIISYCSIFTLIAMNISNKAITAIVSIMLCFLMVMGSLTCFNILESPKTIRQASMINGKTQIEEIPNPKYPSKAKKKMLQKLLNINPAGQMFQIAGRTAPNLKILPLYSLGMIVICTTAGLILFRKKELK